MMKPFWQIVWRAAAVVAMVALQWAVLAHAPRLWMGERAERPEARRTMPELPPLGFVGGHEFPPDSDESGPPVLALSKDAFRGDLDGLLERRHIRVLTTFNRTNFFLAAGKQHGFEYSLLRDYEKSLNEDRGARDLNVHMEFIPVYRDELIPKLLSGEGDIAAAGLTVTPARLREADFTDPYLDDIDEVVVSGRGVKGLHGLDDLSGRTIHVRQSSSYFESLLSLNEELMGKGLRPAEIVKVDESLETEYILDLVNAGTWDITVADSHLAQIWSGVLENIVVHADLKVRSGGRIAWMIRLDSPQLKASLDRFFRTRKKGTLYGNIYFNRYFENNRWVARPLAEGERKKIEQYRRTFEKYSSRYGIPWLLTAAVAYQESGFDNSRMSSTGAVGVMQVLPSTAGDKNIGIDDISGLENNIHAGVKYLAHLRDTYFGEEDLDGENRLHFVLAAYNAGPATVRRARRQAPSWGVDPDRWLKNVEVVVLKNVSQEPVQYVINIHRYYVLFDTYFRMRAEREELATGIISGE